MDWGEAAYVYAVFMPTSQMHNGGADSVIIGFYF
jgi:hypothetical protein